MNFEYKKNSLILLKNNRKNGKLDVEWFGPYVLVEDRKKSRNTIKIRMEDGSIETVNIRKVVPYLEREQDVVNNDNVEMQTRDHKETSGCTSGNTRVTPYNLRIR